MEISLGRVEFSLLTPQESASENIVTIMPTGRTLTILINGIPVNQNRSPFFLPYMFKNETP